MKEKIIIKYVIGLSIALSILLIGTILIFYITDNKDLCLDTGYCKEGLSLNTEFGQITVNQETCIKAHGTWIYDKKYCKFK